MNLLGGCVKWQTKSDDVGVEVLEEFDIQTTKVVQIWMRFKVECSRLIFGQLTNLFSETASRYLLVPGWLSRETGFLLKR